MRRSGGRLASAGLVDSSVSSIGNLAITVEAARSLDLVDFGRFSAAMLLGLLAVGLSRALHGDPLVLTSAALPVEDGRQRSQEALGATTALAAVLAGGAVLAAAISGGRALGLLALALGLVVPLLLLQDSYRWVGYTISRPWAAAGNNCVWTAGVLAVVLVLECLDVRLGPARLLLVWGGTAGPAALWSQRVLHLTPRPGRLVSWHRPRLALTGQLTLDWVLLQATAEGAIVLVAAVAGAADTGLLRKAQVPLSPIVVLTTALVAFLQPLLVRSVATEGSAAVRGRAARTGAWFVTAAAAGTGVVLVLPAGLMTAVLGDSWGAARHLVPLVALQLIAGGWAAAMGIGLRSVGQLGRQVRARLVISPLVLAAVAAGAHYGGATGAAISLAGGSVLLAVLWTVLLWGAGATAPVAAAPVATAHQPA